MSWPGKSVVTTLPPKDGIRPHIRLMPSMPFPLGPKAPEAMRTTGCQGSRARQIPTWTGGRCGMALPPNGPSGTLCRRCSRHCRANDIEPGGQPRLCHPIFQNGMTRPEDPVSSSMGTAGPRLTKRFTRWLFHAQGTATLTGRRRRRCCPDNQPPRPPVLPPCRAPPPAPPAPPLPINPADLPACRQPGRGLRDCRRRRTGIPPGFADGAGSCAVSSVADQRASEHELGGRIDHTPVHLVSRSARATHSVASRLSDTTLPPSSVPARTADQARRTAHSARLILPP